MSWSNRDAHRGRGCTAGLTLGADPSVNAAVGPNNSDAEPTLRGFSSGARVFGRYTLVEILGRGGMGVVWRARDDVLGEDIALKFLPEAVRWDPGAYDDLKDETRRARQLTHPNIVRIHDFVEDGGSVALSMELVAGATLTVRRLAKPHKIFDPDDIVPWLPQLCAALDYAHGEARVVHRDLKPTNIMLTPDGRVKVADFGVARSLADSISRVSMMSAGTLVYMSPQQAMGEVPSPADDIYALGATLCELLTGRPPFHTGDVRMQLFQRRPESITKRRRVLGVPCAPVPDEWEAMVAACLAKEAADRPPRAGDIATALCAPGAARGRRGRWPGIFRTARPAAGGDHTDNARRKRWLGQRILPAALVVGLGLGLWSLRPGVLVRPRAAGFPSDATRALAAWNFDGDGRDASGRGLNGLASQTVPTFDRHGRIDRALHFNGGSVVLVEDSPLLRWGGAQPFTAALWIRRRAGDESPDTDSCWRSMGDEVGTLTWAIAFNQSRPAAWIGALHANAYGEQTGLVAPGVVNSGEWHHVAFVSDGQQASLYVDGLLGDTKPIGANRKLPAPRRVEVRFGRTDRLAVGSFTGDLDDARLWRRALAPDEVAALARRDPPQRFALSRSMPYENEDLAEALRHEFGADVRLADWEEIKRGHFDDAAAWADDLGFEVGPTLCFVQRGGQRLHEGKRHYLLNRFNGAKPDYFEAHDEIGGMTLALGSWFGFQSHALAVLPPAVPRRRSVAATPVGRVAFAEELPRAASALAVVWRKTIVATDAQGVAGEVRLRDGRTIRALCRPSGPGALGFALTASDRAGDSRQVAAPNSELEFTLTLRAGVVRFRGVTAVGGDLVFEEKLAVPEFNLGDLLVVDVDGLSPSAGGTAQPRLATVDVIIE